jgi:outer membrane protein OmpA-like peptidoglycan-associated protein
MHFFIVGMPFFVALVVIMLTGSTANYAAQVSGMQPAPPAKRMQRTIPVFDLGPGGKLVVKDEAFKVASSMLEPNSLPWFDALGKYLTERPDLEVEIRGHASQEGDAGSNFKLSLARADAAKKYICDSFGITPARLHTRGMGDTNPLTSNTTESGRSQNRRVEIIGLSSATNRILTTETGKAAEGDGKLTYLQNKVQIRAPWEFNFHNAKIDDAVYEYHRINTAENSRAEITFNDSSKIRVYENTSMIIYSPNTDRTEGKPQENVRLMNGNLFLTLGGQGKDKFSVKTEGSEMKFDTSSAKIAVDSNRRSTLSVFDGEATVTLKDSVRGDSLITVQEDFGISVQGNKAVVRRAPGMPTLLLPDTTRRSFGATFGGITSPVPFRWNAAASDLSTSLEISSDPAFTTLVFRRVFQDEDSVAVVLAAGLYYFRLSSIDALGIESRPVQGTVRVGGAGGQPLFRFLGFLLLLFAAALSWVSVLINTPFQVQYINSWVVEDKTVRFQFATNKDMLLYRLWQYTIEHRSLLLIMRSVAVICALLAVFVIW